MNLYKGLAVLIIGMSPIVASLLIASGEIALGLIVIGCWGLGAGASQILAEKDNEHEGGL